MAGETLMTRVKVTPPTRALSSSAVRYMPPPVCTRKNRGRDEHTGVGEGGRGVAGGGHGVFYTGKLIKSMSHCTPTSHPGPPPRRYRRPLLGIRPPRTCTGKNGRRGEHVGVKAWRGVGLKSDGGNNKTTSCLLPEERCDFEQGWAGGWKV